MLITILFLFTQKLRKHYADVNIGSANISITQVFVLTGDVDNGNFRPSFFIKKAISQQRTG